MSFGAVLELPPPSSAGPAVVILRGEVDVCARPVLVVSARRIRARNLPVEVITSQVTFMDSCGLIAVLALGGRPIDRAGGTPALLSAGSDLSRRGVRGGGIP